MLEKLKDEVCAANLDLVKQGLVVLTWGNVSGIDRESGLVAIKPSGVTYSKMLPSDMVVVDLDGNRVEGDMNPSSDTPTHLALYRAWENIGGIVHTHSAMATAFAQAMRPVKCFGTTHADTFYGEVPVTRPLSEEEVGDAYEANTGAVIIERFESLDPAAIPGVLVANHAPFTWGGSADAAVKNAVILEEVAKMSMLTVQINPETPALAQYILDKHYFRKHGPGAYYGQNAGAK
jgi:L-ribulose-5-phosphate 4-epimerase